jgi:hypothetical protein
VLLKFLASKPLCLLAFFDVTLGGAFVPHLCQILAHAFDNGFARRPFVSLTQARKKR